MLLSLALILLIGLLFGAVFKKLRLPSLLGMLLTGIILGPHMLNLLDSSILDISAPLREIALIIILVKAGLTLDIKDLKKAGRPAVLMSFLPATFEIIAITLLAPALLNVNYLEAALMGSVLAAVSPAVVVPKMTALIEQNYGTKKCIPQTILAGASLDDVYVIVLFSAFLSLLQGDSVNVFDFTDVPISILLGICIGIAVGYLIVLLFKYVHMRDSVKIVIIFSVAFLFTALEDVLSGVLGFSGLLAVMSMSVCIKTKRQPVAVRLSVKFSKLWIVAEIMLFVLVGASVDVKYIAFAGMNVIVLILLALLIRSIGVLVCLIGTGFNKKEKLFCVLSYIPKATVQAAIGSVALSLGLNCGQSVLTAAVVAIVITAPLGAIAMELTYKKLLTQKKDN